MASRAKKTSGISALLHMSTFMLLSSIIGCSGDGGTGEEDGNTGGATNTGGAGVGTGGAGTGGSLGVGGSGTGGSGTGGFGTGGNGTGGNGTGGEIVGAGGQATGGGLNGTGGEGTGGEGTGGEDQGTGGGPSTVAAPSAGCSNGSPTFNISGGNVRLPDGYDGSTPFPVIFAFHAAGNDASQLENRFGNTVLGDDYVMIYLQASGSGWNYGADVGIYNTAHDQVLANGCVDTNRVYALGHSSGAQMIVQLLCQQNTDFDAVIPIASSVYCQNGWNTPVPVLNIHGTNDQERCAYGLNDCDGAKDIVPYRESNNCEMSTEPADLDVGTSCAGNITPNCMEFQGCDEPTFWCNHNDPQYGTSNHGIPCFATNAISDFLGRL